MSDLISRAAAIDAIDSLYFDTVDDHDRTKERIKRLPSAQPEHTGNAQETHACDCISRQAAIDELIAMREHIESRMSIVGSTAYEMAIEALREPERGTGRWLPDTRTYQIAFVCSECKKSFNVDTINLKPQWSYCPNCGAQMMQEGESNDK